MNLAMGGLRMWKVGRLVAVLGLALMMQGVPRTVAQYYGPHHDSAPLPAHNPLPSHNDLPSHGTVTVWLAFGNQRNGFPPGKLSLVVEFIFPAAP